MSAPIAKTKLSFKMPEMLSYHSTWDDADYEPAQPQQRASLLARAVHALTKRVTAWAQREMNTTELYAMSDRELADIGLARSDIPRICDTAFIAEHADRGQIATRA